jgi:hypothetical protein
MQEHKIYGYSIACFSVYHMEAQIGIHDEFGKTVGFLNFYKDDAKLDPPEIRVENKVSYLWFNYPISRLSDILSILRTEKRLKLHINNDNQGGIMTDYWTPIMRKPRQ